jgi:hypothetical protein
MYAVPTLEEQVEDLKVKRAKQIERQSRQRDRGKGKGPYVDADADADDDNDIDYIINCFEETAEALTSLSLVFQISEKFCISVEDVAVLDHHVQKWHSFLRDFIGSNNFTVNQHYLLHISHFVKEYGPLRSYSTRPMERTVGFCKDNIKSRSKPGENAINFLRSNFTESRQKWYASDKINEGGSKEPLEISLDDFDDIINPVDGSFEDMLKAVCISCGLEFDDSCVLYLKREYKLAHNGQLLKKTRGRDGIDIVYNNKHLRLGNIQEIFEYKGTSLALLKGGNTLKSDQRKIMYVNNSDFMNLDNNWEVIKLEAVMGYAIKLPSMISADKLYICYKK